MLPFRSTFLLTALVPMLAACAAAEKTPPEQPPEVTTPAKTIAKPPRPRDDLANLPRVTMQPPERAMRDGLNGPDAPGPDRLVGLDAAAIQKMFGQPDFKRHDPPAEIWQYRKDGCLLDVFLYMGTDGYHVTHVEARSHSVAQISGTECLLEALAR